MQSKRTFPFSVFRLALLFSSVFAVLPQHTSPRVNTKVRLLSLAGLEVMGPKTFLKPTSRRPRGVFCFLDSRVLLVVVVHGFDLGCLLGDCLSGSRFLCSRECARRLARSLLKMALSALPSAVGAGGLSSSHCGVPDDPKEETVIVILSPN